MTGPRPTATLPGRHRLGARAPTSFRRSSTSRWPGPTRCRTTASGGPPPTPGEGASPVPLGPLAVGSVSGSSHALGPEVGDGAVGADPAGGGPVGDGGAGGGPAPTPPAPVTCQRAPWRRAHTRAAP